jgi:hypothetical protein
LYRLCAVQADAAVQDFANGGLYLPDLAVSPATAPAGQAAPSTVTLSFQTSLAVGDQLWFRTVGHACLMASGASSTSSSSTTVASGQFAYTFQFGLLPKGSAARARVARAGSVLEYPGVTVQVLDTTLTLDQSVVRPVETDLQATFSAQAPGFGDRVWFASEAVPCGAPSVV